MKTAKVFLCVVMLAFCLWSCTETGILLRVYTVEGAGPSTSARGGRSHGAPEGGRVGGVAVQCYAFGNAVDNRPVQFSTDSAGFREMMVPVAPDSTRKTGMVVAGKKGYQNETVFFDYWMTDTVTVVVNLAPSR